MAGSMPASAAEATAPLAVENFSYPGAAKILTDSHVTLKSGDGNIRLADCTSTDNLIEVFSRTFDTGSVKVCFKVTGPSGFLALELPKVYSVKGDDHTVKATLNTGGSVSSIDIKKNLYTPVGEGTSADGTTLLELNATDGPAAPAVTTDTPAIGSVLVGQPGRPGSRACTATLVDRYWALTSAGCFTDTPATLAAGAPATKSTVTIGGKTVDITELVPRTDRDLAMARLATPIEDITLAKVATTAPVAGESLRIPGFGRTATQWRPTNPHNVTHTAGAVTATGLDSTPAAGSSAVCQGDTGAPLLRTANGSTEIVAVASRSWLGGCLDAPAGETRTGAGSTRVDNLGTWIQQTRWRTAQVRNVNTNKCLYVSWRTPDNAAPALQVGCDARYIDQVWKLEPVTGGGYQFRNPVTNRCLVVSWRTPEDNAPVTQYDCNPAWADQVWYLDPVTGGGYQIRNAVTNKCMYVSWRTPEDGAAVLQYGCNPAWNDQVWNLS
ncbi:hypothetical protein F4556_000371 [Kitasatospora gansuensis]|uniref:Peptidase S1 domain-containing protein n=1 Tax=Kitasatospora gansuensis TaxID=258050 RepID=A0A7W7WF35_9ACTN|nr:ricin-type beta-trefoil lectin domain protein [Kitasatospora gansuensis]MBB4944836.1 hypothetical protein [Kitasatospora gansuensis]